MASRLKAVSEVAPGRTDDPYSARLKGVFQVRALDGEQLRRVFAVFGQAGPHGGGRRSRRHGPTSSLAEVVASRSTWTSTESFNYMGRAVPHDVQITEADATSASHGR